jgi:hypothetical protein
MRATYPSARSRPIYAGNAGEIGSSEVPSEEDLNCRIDSGCCALHIVLIIAQHNLWGGSDLPPYLVDRRTLVRLALPVLVS